MPAVGKYEILDPLGTGSMGTVYRARDTVLDRIVALKTIRTGIDVEPESRKRFYREARTCARLQHPHIVTIYDLGEEERTAFISMELLTGWDLRQVIQQKQNLPLAVKLQVMAQICDALAHAHREGVIHRDVKPSNLFLLTDKRAKVLDFGIARLPSSRLTMTGRVLGTPNYMSPEQIRGLPCDGRSDLFSAAVAFFELLVYVHPFRSPLIPRRVVEGEPDSLFDHDSSMPILLEQIFERALSKEPDKRYATGDEFAADLRAVCDALQMNSSPSFSRVELPSKRAAVPAPLPKPPVLGEGLPGEDDPDELRMSEVLGLFPEFEAAVEGKDALAARKCLVRLQTAAGDDPRFREALENCRLRIADLDAGRGGSQEVPSAIDRKSSVGTDGPVAQKKCPACHAGNRKAAAFCIECGEPFADAVAPASPPVVDIEPTVYMPIETIDPAPKAASPTPAPTFADRWRVVKEKASSVAEKVKVPAGWKQRYATLSKDQRRLVWVSVGLVVCALLLIPWPPPPQIMPSVATAVVTTKDAAVRESAGDQKSLIKRLQRGDRVHVLQRPFLKDPRWVFVQPSIGTKVLRPGYIKWEDLTDWKTWTWAAPEDELAMIRKFSLGNSGSEDDTRAQIVQLDRIATSTPSTHTQREAAIDARNLELDLAQRAKDRNDSVGDWLSKLQTILGKLTPIRDDATLTARADGLDGWAKKLIDEWSHVQAPPPPQLCALDDCLLLAQAALDRGRYNTAQKLVMCYEEIGGDREKAQSFLARIAHDKKVEVGH